MFESVKWLYMQKINKSMKPVLQKLKSLDKEKVVKGIKALSAAIVLLSVGSLIMNAQRLHKDFIRSMVSDKVFMLTNSENTSGGTGFLVEAPSGKSYIVTNSHVCNIPGKQLFTEMEGRRVKLRIREVSRFTDLCLVEQPGNLSGLDLASSIAIGEQVGIMGHPRLFPLTLSVGEYVGDLKNLEMPLLEGECPADLEGPMATKTVKFMSFFGEVEVVVCMLTVPVANISTAKALGGSSGSPVVNFWGNIVGVVFGGLTDNNDALVIPLEHLRDFLKPY